MVRSHDLDLLREPDSNSNEKDERSDVQQEANTHAIPFSWSAYFHKPWNAVLRSSGTTHFVNGGDAGPIQLRCLLFERLKIGSSHPCSYCIELFWIARRQTGIRAFTCIRPIVARGELRASSAAQRLTVVMMRVSTPVLLPVPLFTDQQLCFGARDETPVPDGNRSGSIGTLLCRGAIYLMVNKRLRVGVVFGTRPEAIKLAPVISELNARSDQFQPFLIST